LIDEVERGSRFGMRGGSVSDSAGMEAPLLTSRNNAHRSKPYN